MEDTSELAEEIIHHILSYCSMKEEAVASMISRNWYTAYSTRPILKFNESELNYGYFNPLFFQFITNTIKNHQAKLISIDHVCFNVYVCPDMDLYIHEWFHGIIRYSVKKLTFVNRSFAEKITLPKSIYEAKSLQELTLSHCQLPHPGDANLMFQQLKRLKMTLVNFEDEEMFNKILSSCSIVEDVEMNSCSPVKEIIVGRNLENVKRLLIQTWDRLDVPIDLHVPNNVVDLSLGGVLLSERIVDNFGKKFPKLVNLKLYSCSSLEERLCFSSQSLKSLVLGIIHGPKLVDFDIPYLLHFTHNVSGFPSLLLTTTQPKILPKIVIRCKEKVVAKLNITCSKTVIDSSWFIRLRELLEDSLATARVSLKLVLGNRTTVEEVIGFVPGPLLEIDLLELDVSNDLPWPYPDLLLNGFLQFFRPNSVFIPKHCSWRFGLKHVNYIWKILMERKCQYLCVCSYHLHGVEVMSSNSMGGCLRMTNMEAINTCGYFGRSDFGMQSDQSGHWFLQCPNSRLLKMKYKNLKSNVVSECW